MPSDRGSINRSLQTPGRQWRRLEDTPPTNFMIEMGPPLAQLLADVSSPPPPAYALPVYAENVENEMPEEIPVQEHDENENWAEEIEKALADVENKLMEVENETKSQFHHQNCEFAALRRSCRE